jgi:hypothetical protein
VTAAAVSGGVGFFGGQVVAQLAGQRLHDGAAVMGSEWHQLVQVINEAGAALGVALQRSSLSGTSTAAMSQQQQHSDEIEGGAELQHQQRLQLIEAVNAAFKAAGLRFLRTATPALSQQQQSEDSNAVRGASAPPEPEEPSAQQLQVRWRWVLVVLVFVDFLSEMTLGHCTHAGPI